LSDQTIDLPDPVEARSFGRASLIVFAMTGATGITGGIATANLNVLYVLESLSRRSGRKLIVLSLHEDDSDRPDFLNDEVVFLGCRGRKSIYAFRLMTFFRPGGFYCFDHVRLGLPMIPMVALGFRNFVVLAHGSESWKRVRGASKWLFRRARMCLTNSRYTLERMRETFSGFEGRSCALGMSPAHDLLPAETARPASDVKLQAVDGGMRRLGDRAVLLVGRMDPGEREKGHRELLAIWPAVLRDFPDAQLVFAGPGRDRETMMRRAQELEIAPAVFMPGYLAANALKRLYARCHAFVMPSRQEGFGLVYLEAMNDGKPCVGCRGGGGEEIIEDGVTGLLIGNPYEVRELLDAVLRLLGDRALAKRLGRAGSRRLRSEFTPERAQERLRMLLEDLVRCD